MFNNNSSNEFLQNTKIPVFVGTILNTFVFGTNLGLLINYGKLYRRSSLVFHLPIIFLILISICFTSICQYAVWIWYIDISFLLIDQSSFNSKLDVNVENVNNNHFVIINNVENKDLIIWPYAISPIFTGFLIWGVQVILTYRAYILSDKKYRIIPILLLCLSFTQLTFSACRSMEILSIKDFKKTYSKLYIYPFWLITLTISNLLISTLKFYLLFNRFQSLNEYYNFKFNSLNNNKNLFMRFSILIPQVNFFSTIFSLIDLLLFLIRKDSAYLSIDLCLGNIHLFCLLISLNLNQLLRKSEKSFQKSSSKDFKKSQKNKTGDIPMKDLTLEIPMNPLSARLSKSRISSDWTETFVDGIQSNLRNNNGSDLTIRGNSSSSASSFVGSSTTDLSSFKIRKN